MTVRAIRIGLTTRSKYHRADVDWKRSEWRTNTFKTFYVSVLKDLLKFIITFENLRIGMVMNSTPFDEPKKPMNTKANR